MSKKYPPQQLHQPVLLNAALALLKPARGESYLDLTAGYGGHATNVVAKTGNAKQATLVDRDDFAISHLEKTAQLHEARLMHQDFASAAEELVKEGVQFDMVLIDLGVSSPQLDNADRGFSFKHNSLLDMRMDQRLDKTAKDLVNKLNLNELSQLIRDFGEENPRSSNRIAQAIVRHRPIETTSQLADVIKQQHRGKWSKVHPATRTFQALRMGVNDELGQIQRVLPLLPDLLKQGGRVVAISFHSLEDRLVKRYFQTQSESGYEATLQLLNKKPISGEQENDHNPRARSAKLRGAVKINT